MTACVLIVISATGLVHVPRKELASTGIAHGNSDIFLIDVTRGIGINLTRSAGDEHFPVWSPDGQQLIFYSDRDKRTDLYLTDINQRAVSRLVDSGGPGASPAWSADGQWIAYAGIHLPNAGLYLVRPDGSDIRRLTDFPVVTIVWSPDSSQIAFVGNCESNCDIYVVDIGKLKIRQLTHNGLIDTYPAWSPDGQKLAFISNRAMSFELYVIDIDCDETQQGGCPTERLTQNRATDHFPSWSPDGKRIAFSSDRSGNYEVYTVDADCFRKGDGCEKQVTQITHRGGTDILPQWSPDGQQIAFLAGDHNANFDVYVVDIAALTLHLLQRKIPRDGSVAWRPG